MTGPMQQPPRKIIHVDMDAFYAAIEQRDRPELAGKPLVVGGSPAARGVVAACSYEARKYGIHSAMPSAQALKRCPSVIFIKPRFDVYRAVSGQILEVFRAYTDLIEPLSLDEAYLDVTAAGGPATRIARAIKDDVRRATALTASAGVSYNKFLAKIASDVDKPDGLFVITPAQGERFVADLPVRKFHGVGRVTEEKMKALGIETGADLRRRSLDELVRTFGKVGRYYYHAARGVDDRPVEPDRVRKSVGSETTFVEDLHSPEDVFRHLKERATRVSEILVEKELTGRTVTVKVKFADFTLVTRSRTLDHALTGRREILSLLPELVEKTGAVARPVRLLGVSVSNLCPSGSDVYRQLDLL